MLLLSLFVYFFALSFHLLPQIFSCVLSNACARNQVVSFACLSIVGHLSGTKNWQMLRFGYSIMSNFMCHQTVSKGQKLTSLCFELLNCLELS